jgi:hypothetical protein
MQVKTVIVTAVVINTGAGWRGLDELFAAVQSAAWH